MKVPPPIVIGQGSGVLSGWPGSPGSHGCHDDRQRRLQSGWACHVFQLRFYGNRLPSEYVLGVAPRQGLLIDEPFEYDDSRMVGLYAPRWEDVTYDLMPPLHRVRLKRSNAEDNVRLYLGVQRGGTGDKLWPQAWLCTKAIDHGREIVRSSPVIDAPSS